MLTRDTWYILAPSDVKWHHRTLLTLVQVMACCLMAPSHYLNQCQLIINEVLWYSPRTTSLETLKISQELNLPPCLSGNKMIIAYSQKPHQLIFHGDRQYPFHNHCFHNQEPNNVPNTKDLTMMWYKKNFNHDISYFYDYFLTLVTRNL